MPGSWVPEAQLTCKTDTVVDAVLHGMALDLFGLHKWVVMLRVQVGG